MNQNTAKLLIILGGVIILIGLVFYFFADKLHWLGRLPGDIRYEGNHTRIYFPITTMLIVSLILNVVWYLLRKFLS